MSHKKVMQRFREDSLKNRTRAELWAQEIIKSKFSSDQYEIEYIQGNRRFDFFFHRSKIALEIDGGYHKTPEKMLEDQTSDAYMFNKKGIKVLRVDNFDETSLIEALCLIQDGVRFIRKHNKIFDPLKTLKNLPELTDQSEVKPKRRTTRRELRKLMNERIAMKPKLGKLGKRAKKRAAKQKARIAKLNVVQSTSPQFKLRKSSINL